MNYWNGFGIFALPKNVFTKKSKPSAAELIALRADSSKDNMGLTNFKGTKVRKSDVDIAKNYLAEDEISALNRIVTMYLDYAEDQALKHIPMHMADWEVDFPERGSFPEGRTTFFYENASIDLGGTVIKTLKTEGHTPGSTLFLLTVQTGCNATHQLYKQPHQRRQKR